MELNDPFNLNEINSFVHTANKDEIINTYNKYKDDWIKRGILTYYAEDFIKYQDSPKIHDTLEVFILYQIYNNLQ